MYKNKKEQALLDLIKSGFAQVSMRWPSGGCTHLGPNTLEEYLHEIVKMKLGDEYPYCPENVHGSELTPEEEENLRLACRLMRDWR